MAGLPTQHTPSLLANATVSGEVIEPANLSWRGDEPFAIDYDDIYYSGNGEEEFQRVFLQPSQLLSRQNLTNCLQVAELGFGSGLNFVLCAEAVLRHSEKRLHYISFEAHPLAPQDWARLAKRRSKALFTELAAAALPLLKGWHRRSFANGRIHLSVFHGDALEGLVDLQARHRQPVDAWFLDGFDPRKNPQMWRPAVFRALANCSASGTHVSTFTAAGQVRRDLSAVGFNMQRVDQRPRKRESLAGVYSRIGQRSATPKPSQVRVFGAGIAGCTVARELANLGVEVQLFDPHGIASGGSKMQASALHCRLLGDLSGGGEFRARAYHHARYEMSKYTSTRTLSAVQLALAEDEVRKQQRLHAVYAHPRDPWLKLLDANTLSSELGVTALSGLMFADSAIINLRQLCNELVDHPGIEFVLAPGQGHAHVIACASASRDLVSAMRLEIGDVHGQLDWIPALSAPPNKQLKAAIVGNGYVLPGPKHWVIGSTYEQRPWQEDVATAHNIDSNRAILGTGEIHSVQRQRAARCVSSDRDAVIGKVTEDTWVSAAHGSMGSSSAPLAASIIASDLLGWISPASPRALASVAPGRFVARQARRGVKTVGV